MVTDFPQIMHILLWLLSIYGVILSVHLWVWAINNFWTKSFPCA